MDNSLNEIILNDDLDNWFDDNDADVDIINNISESSEPLEQNTDIINRNNENTDSTSFNEKTTNTKIYCVEDILNENPEKYPSYELIQYEYYIASFIQTLIDGTINHKIKSSKIYDNEFNLDKLLNISEYLQWISKACAILANRIGQELIIYQAQEYPAIVRSSYNFCTKNTQCKNFYNKDEKPNCKEHHYVHSLLKHDIDSVIHFLSHIIKNKSEMTDEYINNLFLSIKTICFVTKHMTKEINYINYVTLNNSETFHRNNPVEIKKKNFFKKNLEMNIEFSPKTENVSKPCVIQNSEKVNKNISNPNLETSIKNMNSSRDSYLFRREINLSSQNQKLERRNPIAQKNNGFRKNNLDIRKNNNSNRFSVLSNTDLTQI